MNAWTIYWILQLDSISGTLNVLAWSALLTVIGLTLWNGISWVDGEMFPILSDPEKRAAARAVRSRSRKAALKVAVPLFIFSALVPSTKTAAAMVVLPAIANNERIQHEAGDLYQLAKQALANAVAPAKPEPKK